jgi:uncharacterized membrane protein YhhN
MHPIAPWVVAMSAALGVLLAAEAWEKRALVWIAKPVAALSFVGAGLASGALGSPFGIALLAGLVLCVGGDVLLIPKTKGAFLAGLVSFLLGHVAYAVAFVLRGIDARATALAAGALAVLAVGVGRWLLPHVEPKMKAPVVAYTIVITSMVALAVGTFVARADPLLLAGAIGFYASDLAVARERFVKKTFWNRAWGLPLYFYAQMLLASTAGSASG